MRKNYIIIPVILVLILAAFLYYKDLAGKDTDINTGTGPGELAPYFTLKSINGEEISLSDFRGKKVFLNFWATWCGPCRLEMPDIQRLHEEQPGVQVLTVNLQEEKGKEISFLFTNAYTFPALLDPEGEVSSKYIIMGIPTTYFIDENGVIINKIVGAISYQRMLDMLKIQ